MKEPKFTDDLTPTYTEQLVKLFSDLGGTFDGIDRVLTIISMFRNDELMAPVAIDRIERLFFVGLISQELCDRAQAEIRDIP